MRSNALRRTLAAGTVLGTHGFAAVSLSLALMAAPGAARAQSNNYWLGGDGRWADPSRWTEGVPPNSTLDARVRTGGDIAIDTPDAQVGTLWLESAESAPARAVVASGGILSGGYVMIGELAGHSGELIVNGLGAKALVAGIALGRNGGNATVAVANGGLVQTGVTQAFGNGSQARLVVDGAWSELRTGLLQLRGSSAAPALLNIAAGGAVRTSSLVLEGDVWISLTDGVLAADDVSVTGGANEIAVTTAGTLRLDTRIREFGGTLSLAKMGAGTLQLTGGHDYSGVTTISQGVVQALGAGRNSIGDASAVTIAAGATLALTGGSGAAGLEDDGETIGSLAGSGTVVLGAQTLTVGANDANTIFLGSITGGGSLRKTGTGTLTLAAASSYSGGTTVADGTLVLQANEAIGRGPLTLTGGTLVANAAVQQVDALSGTGAIQVNNNLTVNQATDTLYAGAVSGSGALWKSGSGQLTLAGTLSGGRVNVTGGTLVLTGTNSYAGGTTIGNGAKVVVGTDQALGVEQVAVFGSGGGQIEAVTNVTLANAVVIDRDLANSNLVITGDQDLRLNGVISTSGRGSGGGLIKRGNGVLSVAGANTYSGGTVIEGGVIRLLNDRALGAGAIRMAGGATLSFAGSPWQTLGALTLDGDVTLDVDQFQDAALNRTIAGAGGFTKTGLGTLSLYGDNSFGGDIHVREGRLWVDNWAGMGDRAITDTALVTVDAGATIAFQKSEVFGALSGAGLVDITYAGELGLTVGGVGTDFTFAGNISGGDPVGPNFPSYGLTKIGSGTFTLTGASDSRRGVYVGGGMLAVEGSIASSLVDVGGDGRLGGGGSIAGTVQLYRDGTLVGAAGRTLSMGGLIMNRGAILDVTLGAPGNDTLFDVAGDVRLDGTVNIADGGGFGAAGVYRLISYTGARSGNGLTIGSVPGGVDRSNLGIQTGVAGQVNLVSNAGLTLRFWDGGDNALYDNSAIDGGSGLWTAGGRNWTDVNGVANGPIRPVPAFAVFQGSGGDVTIDTGHLPAVTGMQFAVDGYRLTSGQIALDGGAFTSVRVGDGTVAGRGMTARIESALVGDSGLLVNDLGTLILSGDNSYTGGTRVDAGTLIGSARSIRGDLENGGTVIFEEEGSATFGGDISGLVDAFGKMIKRGDGELILSGSNKLDWSIEAGALDAQAAAFAGNVAIGGDGRLTLSSGAIPGSEAVYRHALSGNGTFNVSGAGTLVLEGASNGFTGATTVAGSTLRVNGSLGGTLLIGADGVLGGSGDVGDVRVDAAGRLMGISGSTLHLASLNLSSGAAIDATFGRTSDPALFDVAGDLTLDGTLNIGGGTPLQAGIYRLVSYGGALTDRGLELGKTPSGQAAADAFVQTAVAGQVNLISSAGVDLRFWDGGDPARHFNGAVDGGAGIWRLGDRNWSDADGNINGSPTPPGFAVFQGTPGQVTLDDSAGALSVTGMQFAANGYRLSGDALTLAGENGRTIVRVGDGSAAGAATVATLAAPLAGIGDLVKTDVGTLVLLGANSYAGNTLVEAGTLIGDAAAIRGNVAAAGTVVFDQASDASFAGTIGGLGDASGSAIKRGAGVLTLGNVSSLDWTIEAGGLVTKVQAFTGDATIGRGASLVFSQAEDGAYAGRLGGQGSLTFAGSAVRLTGDSSGFTGQVSVENGVLDTAGKLGGALTLGAGGWLRGNGTLGSVTVTSGGTVAPGNSIGALTVSGNLTFTPGSRYEVEVDPTGAASDRIDVLGAATLAGSVVHVGSEGNYRPRATYTILTAAGGLQGRFGAVTSDFAFLDPSLGYTANAVTLTLERNDIRFEDVGLTRNQRAVGAGLEALTFGNPVYDVLVMTNATEARAAFDGLSGEIHASARALLVEDSRLPRSVALDRMREADGEAGREIWGKALGSWGHLGRDGNAARIERSAGGGLVGIEGSAGGDTRFGVFGGYHRDDINGHGNADIDSYHVGLYAGTRLGSFALRTGYAYAWHDVSVRRSVAFAGFDDRLRSRYDASTAQAFGEIAYQLPVDGGSLEPFAAITHVAVDSERARERGGAAALDLAQGDASTNFTTLGLRSAGEVALGGGMMFRSSVGWRHTFGDRSAELQAGLNGARFTIVGTPIARDALAAELSVGAALATNVRFDLSYDGVIAKRAEDHAVRASLSWRF